MDYTKLTKQELLDILQSQEEKEIKAKYTEKQVKQLEQDVEEKQKALEDQIKARDTAIVKSVELEEKIKVLENEKQQIVYEHIQEKENLEKSVKFMENKFTDLAKLFDEYIVDPYSFNV